MAKAWTAERARMVSNSATVAFPLTVVECSTVSFSAIVCRFYTVVHVLEEAALEPPRFKETLMCPACLTTLAFVAAGTTSAGGITGFIIHKIFRRRARHTRASSK